jgi:tetratricopeptide (TPR) repeat protein
LKPDYQLSYVGLGDLYKDKLNNTTGALSWYLKAYSIDSTHKKTNYWIGWCYNDLEKYEKAIPYLERIVETEPLNVLAVTELGFSLYSIEKYNEALEVLKKVLTLQPKPELAIYYTGLCYVRNGDKTEAVNRYNELAILNSKYALTLLSEIKKLK